MNLKKVLMELGNRLVTERGFAPQTEHLHAHTDDKSTAEIKAFTYWLNDCAPAREILAEMGIEWPIVERK